MMASVIVGPPLVLTPLYNTQNYYPAALSPAVAMMVGLSIAWAWEHRRAFVGRLALGAGPALWIATLAMTAEYWTISYRPVVDRDGTLAAAEFVRERTEADDWIVIRGRG